MKLACMAAAAALSLGLSGNVWADGIDGSAVIGGGLGGAAGAAVGSAVGGKTGAIVGAGVGAAAGTAIATSDNDERHSSRTVVEKRVVHVYEDGHPGKHKGHHKNSRNKHYHD
jgi:hypothetical protein